MNYQHQTLAAGRWKEMTLLEQMANIGSEVERALNWRAKGNAAYAEKAFDRSLELMDLTLGSTEGLARLKEFARLREVWADYFSGSNQFSSTENSFKKYFFHFASAVRKNH